jgi:hypothetical protein
LEIKHEFITEETIKLHVLHHADEEFRVPKVRSDLVVFNVWTIDVELSRGQICQTEAFGANQVLSCTVGITHQAASRYLTFSK